MFAIITILLIINGLILLRYINLNKISQSKFNFKLKELENLQKNNNDISDRYIEQLHTKISELEVTLQNVVNKL